MGYTPFKMKGFSGFGNSPMKQDKKKKVKEKGPSIFGKEIKDIKTGFSNIGKEIAVKADQIPYIGPSSSVYSTKAKAGGGSGSSGSFYDEKATINQPGYEDIKARITGTPREKTLGNVASKTFKSLKSNKKITKSVKPIKRFTKTKRKIARKVK
tara:strand:+ start:39 stop:500 length:462 start_codon:yes stop_codon:yes gene_type:complete